MASDEDQELFEMTDFTTASDWERFVAHIEEIIHEWKLPNLKHGEPLKKGDLRYGTWTELTQQLSFADFKFNMSYHSLKTTSGASTGNLNSSEEDEEDSKTMPESLTDMMNINNDFCIAPKALSNWYGLRHFIVLSPARGMQVIANESRAKLLLSSVCVAINNTNCYIPTFIQLHHRNNHFYLGICEGRGIRTDFQMVHLNRPPVHSAHLAGLLDVFKTKLNCPYSSLPPVTVSICFTYLLKDWDHSASWPQQPPDFDNIIPSLGGSELSTLPFGAWEDPVSEIRLCTIWPRLNEHVVVDNSVSTDLDPSQAPLWCIRIQFTPEPTCLLVEHLSEFGMLCDSQESTEQLLGLTSGDSDNNVDLNIVQALDRLTNQPPVVNPMKNAFNFQTRECPIPEEKLKAILFFLFPDAVGKNSYEDDVVTSKEPVKESDSSGVEYDNIKATLNTIKSAPVNSLLYYLAICMCHVNHVFGRVYSVAHLWHEFVLEMRHRWDRSLFIPGVEKGQPNLSTCLLHQKLQMLNYCIERKKLREMQLYEKKGGGSDDNSSEEEEEEEFFECSDEVDDGDADDPVVTSEGGAFGDEEPSRPKSDFSESDNYQPEGRLRPCGNLKLIQNDETLYIPVTQEPAPMTEDELEEHAEVLIQLGTDEQGIELRAQMQSACLMSDMQAFKAANPGCCLEDFVRWYSPYDWVEEEDSENITAAANKCGHLSKRMLIPGNLWQEVWQNAKPIPIRRQRRLFDDTKEGEKVLHFLASMKPADVVLRLMPMIIHAAILTLLKHNEPLATGVLERIQSIAAFAAKLSKRPIFTAATYKEVIDQISAVEILLSQCKALKNLFQHSSEKGAESESGLEEVIGTLLEKRELYLHGGVNTPTGKWILKLLQESYNEEDFLDEDDTSRRRPISSNQKQFPCPEQREFILRCCVRRPASYSASVPQRMYALLSNNDYRLAGAFSQDTTFQ